LFSRIGYRPLPEAPVLTSHSLFDDRHYLETGNLSRVPSRKKFPRLSQQQVSRSAISASQDTKIPDVLVSILLMFANAPFGNTPSGHGNGVIAYEFV